MFERFTDRARRVMAFANRQALRLNHPVIDTPHELLGLLEEESGVARHALRALGLDFAAAMKAAEEAAGARGEQVIAVGKLPQTAAAKRIIEQAISVARELNHNYVGTEHLCLALIREPGGVGARVLGAQGITPERLLEEVRKVAGVGTERVADPGARPRSERLGQSITSWAILCWLAVLTAVVIWLAMRPGGP